MLVPMVSVDRVGEVWPELGVMGELLAVDDGTMTSWDCRGEHVWSMAGRERRSWVGSDAITGRTGVAWRVVSGVEDIGPGI